MACPRAVGECDCVVVRLVSYFSGESSSYDEEFHFAYYHHSPFLVGHREKKGPIVKVELDNPTITKEILEFLVWYTTPPDPIAVPPPRPGAELHPLRGRKEVFDRAVNYRRTKKCEFVEKLLVAADHFRFEDLVEFFAGFLRRSLMSISSVALFRKRLDLENDIPVAPEVENSVWERNSVDFTNAKGVQASTLHVTSESKDHDLAQSLASLTAYLPDIQPPARKADDDILVSKCSFPGCEALFSMYSGRHHCRKCGQIFCALHSSRSVRLPENEKVEPEVGFVSSWYTYVSNFGDTSKSRICDTCYEVIEEEGKCRSAFLAFSVIGLDIPLLNRALVVTKSWRHAAQKCLGILANVQYKLPEDTLDIVERRMLWNNREYLVGHPRWMLQVIRAADLSSRTIAEEVYTLVDPKTPKRISCRAAMCNCLIDGVPARIQACEAGYSPTDLVQFLKSTVTEDAIRKFAAKALEGLVDTKKGGTGAEELRLYLPLLVELLPYESLPDPSPLFDTLVLAAIHDPGLRSDLYWALDLRGKRDYKLTEKGYESKHAARYESLKMRLLLELAASEECGQRACEELVTIYSICQVFRSIPQGLPLDEVKKRLTEGLAPFQDRPTPCVYDPTHMVTKYHVNETKILSSATKPIVVPITIECSECSENCPYRQEKSDDVFGKGKKAKRGLEGTTTLVKKRTKRRLMYKYEDVRKDYLMLNVIKLMDFLLRRELKDLDSDRVTYRVIPTSVHDGFVEFVEGAFTIYEVSVDEDRNIGTIQNWLLENKASRSSYADIRKMYVKTMAFWSVVTLLLGIGDRHSCNIMIKPNGALFHIDYGFILGEDPKLGSPLMRITGDMINVMGGRQSKNYAEFKYYCSAIYRKLREHSEIFFDLCRVLFILDPPLDGKPVPEARQQALMSQLQKRFNWKVASDKAGLILLDWIDQSASNPLPDIYDLIRGGLHSQLRVTPDPGKEEGKGKGEESAPGGPERTTSYFDFLAFYSS